MNTVERPTLDPAHLAQAWQWVLRLQEGAAGADDIAAWLRWYEADDSHRQAFEDMQCFWEQLDRVTEEPRPLQADSWRGVAASAARDDSWLAPSERPTRTRRSMKYFQHRWTGLNGLARPALVAATALVCLLLTYGSDRLWTPVSTAIQAQAGEIEKRYLVDGSQLELAPKSSIDVRYSREQRTVLLQSGEAFFSVAHNPRRPFIVQVGALRVRAVGTAFNVRTTGERVVVAVTEGIVEVYSDPLTHGVPDGTNTVPPPLKVTRVAAGHALTWTAAGGQTSTLDPDSAVGWRQGRLQYLNEPLSSAITDINRYSSKPVVIQDAAVGRIVFSGTVLTQATDAWVQALPSLFPVDLHTDASGTITLVSRSGAGVGAQ